MITASVLPLRMAPASPCRPVPARLRLRFCEYNAQAQLELLIDKGEFDQLQPLAHPAAERWLYSLQPVSEGER